MIRELIIVEGKNDAHIVRRALGMVDIIWTEGYGLTEEKFRYIEEIAKRQGVIVFTDPDTAGEQIRERIRRRVPGAKHVFLSKKAALKNGDIGVENAELDEIRHAFANIQRDKVQLISSDTISLQDLAEAGLVGQPLAAEKRIALGRYLGIGDANAKQFLHRLNRFGISQGRFWSSVQEVARFGEGN
ncbi:MAG: ribonuclease M5 [Desulfitobacteriaceae bacterium]|nr:ribonuclease M5 [Desulfitobacteriaceae bacterium]MDD4347103.1 ribonuclease M5 [Desulfitobacteriaceae bacterium]MDD4400289.1 ribonuclease M5 [Desulfitobacteriaceae bacterium]